MIDGYPLKMTYTASLGLTPPATFWIDKGPFPTLVKCRPTFCAIWNACLAPKSQIRLVFGQALDVERKFAGVVIAPHARFAVRHFLTGGDVVPAVGSMITAVRLEVP